MKIFDEGNWGKCGCSVCNTKKKGKVILIPIIGKQDGYNVEAKQIHVDCLDLWLDEKVGLIFHKLR